MHYRYNREVRREYGEIIRKHYNMNRDLTDKEISDEIANLNRRIRNMTCDDSYELLAASLKCAGWIPDIERPVTLRH
jgi:hypothetical protein